MNVAPSKNRGEKMKKIAKDLKTKKEENMAFMDES